MITNKMKRAVEFCEQWCTKFNGDINNYQEVSVFLKKYLKIAKEESTLECNKWSITHGYD